MNIRALQEQDKAQVEEIFYLHWQDDFRAMLQKKLEDYISQTDEIIKQDFQFFVYEENRNILGVCAYRNAPTHMMQFTTTAHPAELYVNAVKEKGKGVGSQLRDFRINAARSKGYTELIFFSGDTHQDAWEFHDNSGFHRAGAATAPNGEEGYVWRMLLN